MAASSFLPDIWSWIQNLPPISEWKTNHPTSISISPSSSSQPSLELSITKQFQSSLTFSIIADYNLPVFLWTSKPINLNNSSSVKLLDDSNISNLLLNVIEDVLKYCPNRNTSLLKLPKVDSDICLKDVFNLCFLSLTFVICIYEAPADLRSVCLETLKNQLSCQESQQVWKLLMRLLGSNIEEQWMRTINLAITNWIVEVKSSNNIMKTPSPLFSYSLSRYGLWKVQLYCPVIAMVVENSNHHPSDDRLMFSLNYHQLEGVIQLNYKVAIRDKWIDVMVNTDNIRYVKFSSHELVIMDAELVQGSTRNELSWRG